MAKKTFTTKEIENDLISKIDSRIYKPNQKIPTERELMEIYGVSRMTVRNAVNNLIGRDIAYRIAGRGAFVQRDFIQKSNQIKSYTQLIIESGRTPSTKVLSFKKIIPDEHIREILNLKEGEEVFCLERVRYADDIPMCHEHSYFPVSIFPDFDKVYKDGKSTYSLIANHYHITLRYLKRTISAVKVSSYTSELLYGKNQGFALNMDGVVYDDNNRPIQSGDSMYNADYFTYVSINMNK